MVWNDRLKPQHHTGEEKAPLTPPSPPGSTSGAFQHLDGLFDSLWDKAEVVPCPALDMGWEDTEGKCIRHEVGMISYFLFQLFQEAQISRFPRP